MLARLVFFVLCLCFALPVHAADDYRAVTWTDLLHTMIRFSALDLTTDNNLFDEYAMITDCDLYHYYFKDDFKWNQIRGMIRQANEKDSATYPTRYRYDEKFQLDRYDFDAGLYRFTPKSQIHHLGSIIVFDFTGPECDTKTASAIPVKYKAQFVKPIDVPGLEMSQKDSEKLLHYMDVTANNDHYIFARFNIGILYMEPLRKSPTDARGPSYVQAHSEKGYFVMDARVDSVEFYRDKDMTELVYTYKPPPQ